MSDETKGHEQVCLVCGARRTMGERYCGKCAGNHVVSADALVVREGAEVSGRRLREHAEYRKSQNATKWSRRLQRYVWASQWTAADMGEPEPGTIRRFPGSAGTEPIGQNPADDQRELDLSGRYDLKE